MSDRQLMEAVLEAWVHRHEIGGLLKLEAALALMYERVHEAVQQPAGWIYEDDEGRMTFSQMPMNPPFWEPVFRAKTSR